MKNRLLLLLLVAILMAGCSASTQATRPTAEQYFQEGEKNFENGLYEEAISSWEKVRDTYFSPELNMLAELKIAETYYLSERYPEAAAAYADFLKQHPYDDRLAMVTYRLGLSHFQQMLSADRDQTSTENALQVFQDYLNRFPKGQNAAEVTSMIQRCRNRLADHELYVGWFYLRIKQYQASIKRLEQVLEKYPELTHRDEAYFYLLQDYLKTGDHNKANEFYEKLYQQFPGSKYLKDAEKILSKSN